MIDVCFVDVFIEKINVKSKMSYLIQNFLNQEFKIDIFDHWNENYKQRIQKIINKHVNLFRNELNKFNDNVEMFISFNDEKNVIELKQAFFSLTTRDRRAIDEILNSLLHQKRL